MTEQWEFLKRKLHLIHLFTLTIYKDMKWLTMRGINVSLQRGSAVAVVLC